MAGFTKMDTFFDVAFGLLHIKLAHLVRRVRHSGLGLGLDRHISLYSWYISLQWIMDVVNAVELTQEGYFPKVQ